MIQAGYTNSEYHGPMLVEIRREVGDILGNYKMRIQMYEHYFIAIMFMVPYIFIESVN